MKEDLMSLIAVIGLVYLIKKGTDSATATGEKLNFLQTLKRGFELTFAATSTGAKTSEPETATEISAFSGDLNRASFPSYEPAIRAKQAARESMIRTARGLYIN